MGDRAVQRDAVAGSARSLDRHEPRAVVTTVRLHHEMRHAARNRVDHDVGEFAERRVRAMNGAAKPEPHRSIGPRLTQSTPVCSRYASTAAFSVGKKWAGSIVPISS